MIKKILNFFKKKKPSKMPYEYILVDYTEPSKRSGNADEFHKEIKLIRAGKTRRSYPFSESLLNAENEKKNLPILDLTEMSGGSKLPVLLKDNPSELTYATAEKI